MTILIEGMIFWGEEEEVKTRDFCENFSENILDYMLDNYVLDLDIEELYVRSLEKSETVEDISFSNIYYDSKYEYII